MISRPGRPLSGARRTAELQPPGDMAKSLAEKFFGKLPDGGGLPVISELRVQNYRLSANWPNFLTTFLKKNSGILIDGWKSGEWLFSAAWRGTPYYIIERG